jgi:hypothetical protein
MVGEGRAGATVGVAVASRSARLTCRRVITGVTGAAGALLVGAAGGGGVTGAAGGGGVTGAWAAGAAPDRCRRSSSSKKCIWL